MAERIDVCFHPFRFGSMQAKQLAVQMEPEKIDVSSYLINASKKRGSMEENRNWLNGDSIAIIIAGRYVLLLSTLRGCC